MGQQTSVKYFLERVSRRTVETGCSAQETANMADEFQPKILNIATLLPRKIPRKGEKVWGDLFIPQPDTAAVKTCSGIRTSAPVLV